MRCTAKWQHNKIFTYKVNIKTVGQELSEQYNLRLWSKHKTSIYCGDLRRSRKHVTLVM